MTLQFSEKFDHPFSHVFIYGKVLPESYGFVDMPVTRLNNLVSIHKFDRDKLEHISLIQLATGIIIIIIVIIIKTSSTGPSGEKIVYKLLTKTEKQTHGSNQRLTAPLKPSNVRVPNTV